jgi:hypothetical protein
MRGTGTLTIAALLSAGAYAACALPDDFVKVPATAGGSGGAGGGGGVGGVGGGGQCTPFTTTAPDDCDQDLLEDAGNCCEMGRSCGGAACSDGRCEPEDIEDAPNEALGMVLLGEEVIWATGYGNQLLSSSLSGGPPSILYDGDTYVTMVATDGDRVFFTRYDNGEVWSVDPDVGASSAQLLSDNSGHESWFGRIAVDDTNVYWVSQDDDGHTPAVWFAPKGGGAAAAIAVGGYPVGVASDDNYVYWTDSGSDEVLRCIASDLDGCSDIEVFAPGQSSPSEIVIRDDTVYWLASGALFAKPTAGGATTILGDAADDNWGLALDDTHAYWTASSDGLVFRTPRDGVGDTVEIASLDNPLSVAVSCNDVVVTTSLGTAAGRLVRFPK